MRPQITSRTPGVVDGLLALLRADTDNLEKVQILDGPPVGESSYEDDVVQVAPGDPGEAGILIERIPQPGLGRKSYVERTEVTILVSTFSGDTDMKARRDRATEVFNAIKALVDANLVADTWDALYLGPQEVWHQIQHGEGCTAYVGFTIVAESIG